MVCQLELVGRLRGDDDAGGDDNDFDDHHDLDAGSLGS